MTAISPSTRAGSFRRSRSVPRSRGRILEPAAGRGHISLELRRAGFDVVSFDLRRYADPLVHDIGIGDIRRLSRSKDSTWVVTNLPYRDLTELTAHLTRLGARDRCGVALLVRAEWLIPKAAVSSMSTRISRAQ